MEKTFDVIVIGAGAIGSATTYHLAQANQRVLLLEQFDLDHQKGSSYGASRIIRYSYNHPTYIDLAKAAYPAWMALQAELEEPLYTQTGGIDFGPSNDSRLLNTIDSLRHSQIPHELLSPQEAASRFPLFRFDRDMKIVYQHHSGILAASKCVLAHIRLATSKGATVKTNIPVLSIQMCGDGVEVETATERYTAGKVAIAAGAWSRPLLLQLGLDLPLTPIRCQLAFFQPHTEEQYEPSHFPIFVAHLQQSWGNIIYGIPGHRATGLKVAFHGGQPTNHPDRIDYTPDSETIAAIRQFSRQYLPGADAPLKSSRICLYTMTPDEHFIIDQHPEYPQVVFGAGFSGHGFKFSTLIGRILCDLALTGKTDLDISLFKATRF